MASRLCIQLCLFSGLPDPKWTIGRDNAHFDAILHMIQARDSTPFPSILGYRGFDLVAQTPGGDTVLTQTVGRWTDTPLERLLLNAVRNIATNTGEPLRADLVHTVEQEINRNE